MSETGKQAFRDAFDVLCGKLLGEGIHRKVFECRLDPTLVVKVETDEEHRSFANAYEHRNWQECRDYKPVARWLAPVVRISPCGFILLQKRVAPLRQSELPAKLPRFLTDIQVANFGLYEGRIVACDYTTLLTNVRLSERKAHW